MPHRRSSRSAAVLVALVCASLAAAAESPNSPGAGTHAATVVRCTANTSHPISVRVRVLDPVARNAVVRLNVSAFSAVALEQVEARMLSTGGATNLGPTTIALGDLAAGRTSAGVFTLSIPASGGRQYVQFLIVGRGPQGNLSRGACYNLLPDGPAQVGRLVVTPLGARVLETRAGRID